MASLARGRIVWVAVVEQPSGTVTLVFTDVEGSTALLRELGKEPYREAMALHRRIVREACARRDGYEVDYEGEAFFYAFQSATAAVAAVEEALGGLESGPIRLRVGIHTGEPGLDPPKYVGLEVHLAARVMAAGHGGQVLLTRATRELVDVVVRNLGEHRLKDIPEPVTLFQLGGGTFPPLRTLTRSNLPVPMTTFLGREQELEHLRSLLARGDVRLVTLTGLGGTGKTRLALELGRLLEQEREVLFVDLSAATDENALLAMLAAGLGVAEQAQTERLDAISTALTARGLLLILDNCEHIVEPVARLVESLLANTREPRLLATSREPLHLRGEHRVALMPLSVPGHGDPRPERAEAVRLFLDRMRMTRPALTEDAATVRAVAGLVRVLDGLPLAIELAASRAAHLGVAEVSDRLDARFRILTATERDASDRHRSLEAAIDWSYELLSPPAQAVFRVISVFPASFSLAAAEAVIGPEALELVPALADASLLTIEDAGAGIFRYRLLDTIRVYAGVKRDLAGETDEADRRVSDWAIAIAEQAAATLDTPTEQEGLSVLDREGEICAAALSWAQGADPAAALRLTLALSGWRRRRGQDRENADALIASLEANPTADTAERARALLELARAVLPLGELGRAETLATEAADLFRGLNQHQTVEALCWISAARRNLARLDEAATVAHEALELARATDDPSGAAYALTELGLGTFYAGDLNGAYQRATEALRLPADRLSADVQARRQQLLAVVTTRLGKLDEAAAACEAGIAAPISERNRQWLRGQLAGIRFRQNRTREAVELGQAHLEYALGTGDRIEIGNDLAMFARWAAVTDHAQTAALLVGTVERTDPGYWEVPGTASHLKESAHPAEAALGHDVYTEVVARGRELDMPEVLVLIRELADELQAEAAAATSHR